MKLNSLFLAIACSVALAACSGASTSSGGGGNSCSAVEQVAKKFPVHSLKNQTPLSTNINEMSVTVNGSQCSGAQYFNEPCVSVTICKPNDGQNHCQTINNLLLDTGSYGLRIFKSVISVQLEQAYNGNLPNNAKCVGGANMNNTCWGDTDCPGSTCGSGDKIADCAHFGDGSSDWGPVQYADVQIGGEPVITNLPIQVIDSTFSGVANCGTSPDVGPCDSFFNGILGIGLNVYDNTSDYFHCSGSSCTAFSPVNAKTITNPIAQFPLDTVNNTMGLADNNGTIFILPDISGSTTGTSSVNGTLVFGIDTESGSGIMTSNLSTNMAPSPGTGATHAPVAYAVNPANLTFQVSYKGVQTSCATGSSNPAANCHQDTSVAPDNTGSDLAPGLAIIDSGSNGLYYPDPNMPCAGGTDFYCPLASMSLTATNAPFSGGAPMSTVPFFIVNSGTLLNSGHSVFYNIGADAGPGGDFDWGLPFFFGRNVYTGITGRASGLATGPYWAY